MDNQRKENTLTSASPPHKKRRDSQRSDEAKQTTPTYCEDRDVGLDIPKEEALENQSQMGSDDHKNDHFLTGKDGTKGQIGGSEKRPSTLRHMKQRPGVLGRSRHSDTFLHARDPLNLFSVEPDDPNNPAFNKPLEVFIPKDVRDPLNLMNTTKSSGGSKRGKKSRKRRRDSLGQDQQDVDNMIVSPVVSQRRFSITGKDRKRISGGTIGAKRRLTEEAAAGVHQPGSSKLDGKVDAKVEDSDKKEAREQRQKEMTERYRYGNFNFYHQKKQRPQGMFGYYGVVPSFPDPHANFQLDPRVEIFCADWFNGDVDLLDIGCNAGLFTISMAIHYKPRRILGLDLDSHLICAARKNLRHFADKDSKLLTKFPASFAANFGPISAPSTSKSNLFPHNIAFACENYVLQSDDQLENIREEFDIIFALATIMWVHLNWGDAGVRRFFQRVFRQLRTGGRFILETAPFKAYRKHCYGQKSKNPPDEVRRTFESISFKPEEFTEYLLSQTVGFSHHEELDTPLCKSLGITGRLQVFYKGKFMIEEGQNYGGYTSKWSPYAPSAQDGSSPAFPSLQFITTPTYDPQPSSPNS